MQNEITKNVYNFILAGNAEFSLIQDPTPKSKGCTVKYKLRRCRGNERMYFIHSEGKTSKNLFYQGYISFDRPGVLRYMRPRPGKNPGAEYNEAAVKALLWLIAHANSLPSVVHIVHHGKCSRCGRKLTDAESLVCGLGPECRKKVNI